jgi:hypothetical protein
VFFAPNADWHHHLHVRNLDGLRSHRDKRFPLLANVADGTHVANGTAIKKAV